MIAIITLLCVLTFSLFITRVATVALAHTGLSREAAQFQARSAFTGVGFTTTESEKVVNHPVRRRILMNLMLIGNAGIVTVVSSLILTFISLDGPSSQTALNVALLVAGLLTLLLIASNQWVDRKFSVLIGWMLKHFTNLDVKDYDSLLQLKGDYRVTELFVQPGDWLAERSLADMNLRDEGLNVLGIKRSDGSYDGTPSGDTQVYPSDNVILYGRVAALEKLDCRRKGWLGDADHRKAVAEQDEHRQFGSTAEPAPST